MQAAGAGGSNAYKSGLLRYSGCGGGSGACMAAVFKLDNIVGLQSLPTRTSTPVLRFYIPTITAANTSGKSFYVQIPLGSYSNPT